LLHIIMSTIMCNERKTFGEQANISECIMQKHEIQQLPNRISIVSCPPVVSCASMNDAYGILCEKIEYPYVTFYSMR
jgi:hypothetical protein